MRRSRRGWDREVGVVVEPGRDGGRSDGGDAGDGGGVADVPEDRRVGGDIGGKAGDLEINVASTLNTKMAALGEKISIPKFGPQPALAGAGGRGSSMFEMTPGTRTGPQGAGVAARIDDTAPGRGPGSASTTDVGPGGGSHPSGGATDPSVGGSVGEAAARPDPARDTPDGRQDWVQDHLSNPTTSSR